jgi:NAD(P)H-hydrate epimerase
MFTSLSCSEIRRLDSDAIQSLGLPSLLLMENAARGVVDAIVKPGPWNSITIVAGPGNNGGDGFAAARQLSATGIDSHVFLLRGNKTLSADAESNLQFLARSGVDVVDTTISQLQAHCKKLNSRDLIVDSLLGTGIRGIVSSPFADAIIASTPRALRFCQSMYRPALIAIRDYHVEHVCVQTTR